ncbi:MAG: cupin domain-containing protein [Acidimicrobiia bacterium]
MGVEEPMLRVVWSDDLPRLTSTRDGRDRIDLVTSDLFETPNLKADRITYHPGDTAAAHYHRDCEHYFFILEGNGVLHVNEEVQHLGSGDVALVEKDEVHWFENHGPENFVFIELWVPTPSDTVWVDPDDI